MNEVHEQIQYIEFLSKDFDRIKEFYAAAFGWKFTDYGPEYTAFSGTYVEGGFALGEPVLGTIMPIIYSQKLAKTQKKVEAAGGIIVQEIFSFPGGKRFEFTDPDKNRLAVWTKEG